MSSLFESYEKQFGNLTTEITFNMGKIPQLTTVDERQRVIRETSILFDETRDLIEQMSLEVQELPSAVKEKYSTRLKFFEAELDKLKTEFKKPKYAPRAMASLDADEESLREEVLFDSDMRARLLDNTDRLARSSNRLDDGVRVALQTEEIGGHILTDLTEQREKLQRSRNRLHQADEDLNKSSRIVVQMTRRLFQNRVVLIGIIILMIVIFVGVIYMITKPRASPVMYTPEQASAAKGKAH